MKYEHEYLPIDRAITFNNKMKHKQKHRQKQKQKIVILFTDIYYCTMYLVPYAWDIR